MKMILCPICGKDCTGTRCELCPSCVGRIELRRAFFPMVRFKRFWLYGCCIASYALGFFIMPPIESFIVRVFWHTVWQPGVNPFQP